MEQRAHGWMVHRLVGHVHLPSGTTLRIRSRKSTAASVLAWSAYVDPSLRLLTHVGSIPEGAGEGDLGGLLAHLFTRELLRVLGAHGLIRHYARLHVSSATIRG